jgi:hypothetical protein
MAARDGAPVPARRERAQRNARLVSLFTTLLSCGACGLVGGDGSSDDDETAVCPLVFAYALSGTVFDSAGRALVPDRVFLQRAEVFEECSIEVAPPRYVCAGIGGDVTLVAFIHDRKIEEPVTMEGNRCALVPQQRDVFLPGPAPDESVVSAEELPPRL